MEKKHFCTCRDYKCSLHPVNHNLGCSPCVEKNLNTGEIPACFFRDIHDDLTDINDFSYKGFCDFYNKYAKTK